MELLEIIIYFWYINHFLYNT